MLEGMKDISGRQPIIYTTSSWWSYYAGDPDYGADYPFWLAQYNDKMTRWTAKIRAGIIMWQFTDKIKIAGCPTMDGNWWMGTEEELRQFTNTEITIKKIEENRIKKNIWSLSRANRRWIEENLGRV
jgi:GH25 family lysozyme M1 (1,4-beta-N-acetylmuramidase)